MPPAMNTMFLLASVRGEEGEGGGLKMVNDPLTPRCAILSVGRLLDGMAA